MHDNISDCSIREYRSIIAIPYSRNISRAPIFEDFCLPRKFYPRNFWLLIIIVAQMICEPRKFYHEIFQLKQNLLNLEIFQLYGHTVFMARQV